MNKQVRRDKRVMRTISIGGKRKQTDIQSRFSEAIQVIFLEMTCANVCASERARSFYEPMHKFNTCEKFFLFLFNDRFCR